MGFVLRWVDRMRATFEGDVILGLVFLGLLQGNIAHLERDPDQSMRWSSLDATPPDELRRPMRLLALAESLGLPRESVRRKVALLVDGDAAVRTPRGYYVPGSLLAGEANVISLERLMSNVQDMVAGLARGGLAGLSATAPPPVIAPRHRLVARIATDYGLRALDDLRIAFDGEAITGLIFLALVHANLPPPDSSASGVLEITPTGRPITVQSLAIGLGVPRETMRRHVRRLLDRGLCRQTPTGLVALDDPLARPELLTAASRNEVHQRLMLAQMRRSGVLSGAEGD